MVTEPPHYDPAALPPVPDRRAPERRSEPGPVPDRSQLARTAAAAAIGICGGLAILFVFFWVLGAIDVKDAVGATIVAVMLAGVWLAAFMYRRRQEEPPMIRHDRERRGF